MNSRALFRISIIVMAAGLISCGGDDAEPACSGALCPYVGNWQLQEVAIDGAIVTEDLSSYKLDLKAPQSDPAVADFIRTPGNGQVETGEWKLSNNNDVLVLSTADGDEEYIIEDSDSNTLILVLNREGEKPGPSQFRYVFRK